MNVFQLDKYINRVANMIERKRKAVRNSQGDSYWIDSVKLDFYQLGKNYFTNMQEVMLQSAIELSKGEGE